jgi:hypothetical protein
MVGSFWRSPFYWRAVVLVRVAAAPLFVLLTVLLGGSGGGTEPPVGAGTGTARAGVRAVTQAYLPTLWAIHVSGDSSQHSLWTWATWFGANVTMAAWLRPRCSGWRSMRLRPPGHARRAGAGHRGSAGWT